uniref:Uncharacterized protein n=1 Tax=Hyaloperonospora arabidopsidis (strain Emoy2) TaxID=559515 RepID=M4BYS6_HYAAE
MNTVRASTSKTEVRLERKLRYEFAKLKAKTVAGHSVLASDPYTPTSIGGKRVGCKLTLSATLKNVNGTQGVHATSPATGIDLCDDAISASPHGTLSSLARRATQEGVGVSVKAHEDLVSEMARLRESFTHVQTALDHSVTERKQIREILD